VAKAHREQSRGCGCNSMTLLIFLNIFLIIFLATLIFFAVLVLSGNGSQNWFNGWGFETQAIHDPNPRGPLVEQVNLKQRSDVIYL
jgi:hypothetical protein